MNSRTMGMLGALAALASARVARADPEREPGAPTSQESRPSAATDGAFLPFTQTASSRPTSGMIHSGYDGARKIVVYQAFADAHVVDRLSVRAGYVSNDLSGQATALFGARYQLLEQSRHGLDLGIGLFYAPYDVDGEGLVKASLALGRRFGSLGLFGTVVYGQDPEGDDHRAELSLASLYTVAPAFLVGFDARARSLVFSSDAKHNGISEPVLDVAAGPLGQFVVGPVALSGQVGFSAVRLETHGATRKSGDIHYGPIALLGAGLSL